MVFTASLLGAQHNKDIVENKPASLLVVSLGKALDRMPPFSCGRQVIGPSSLSVVMAMAANSVNFYIECKFKLEFSLF